MEKKKQPISDRYKVGTVFEAEHKWQPGNKARFLVAGITPGHFSSRFELMCLYCSVQPGRIGKTVMFYEYQMADQEEKNYVRFIPEEPEREWLIGLQEIAVSIDDSAWFNNLKQGKLYKGE